MDLSEKEHLEILEAYDIYMWDDDDLKDLFDDYLQDLKDKIVSSAMPYMLDKWGEKAKASMEGQCNGVKIDYCKRYDLHCSEMEIRLYGDRTYTNELIENHLKTCGREIVIKYMSFHYLVYIPSKEDETDIQILLPLLDQLEKDSAGKE